MEKGGQFVTTGHTTGTTGTGLFKLTVGSTLKIGRSCEIEIGSYNPTTGIKGNPLTVMESSKVVLAGGAILKADIEADSANIEMWLSTTSKQPTDTDEDTVEHLRYAQLIALAPSDDTDKEGIMLANGSRLYTPIEQKMLNTPDPYLFANGKIKGRVFVGGTITGGPSDTKATPWKMGGGTTRVPLVPKVIPSLALAAQTFAKWKAA